MLQQSCKGAYLSAAWLRRESLHINVLICSRTTCGLARLSAPGTSVWRQSPEKQSVVVLSLGWSLPWRFKEQGPGCPRKGSPRQVPFFCVTFSSSGFQSSQPFVRRTCDRGHFLCFPLSVDFLLRFGVLGFVFGGFWFVFLGFVFP